MKEKLGFYVFLGGTLVGLVFASLALFPSSAHAADGEFYLQVSPSPLVVTLQPGQTSSYDVKIRNAGSEVERLSISPRTFVVNDTTGDVTFDDTKLPPEIGSWTSFSAANFTVSPGEWYTQKVTFNVPKEAGFSYSFALVITRQKAAASLSAGQELKGSVAIFALVNIDKPGATRSLQLEKLSTYSGVYEYLPAKINVQLKNTGNSIVRPNGNVFIQRSSHDQAPLSTLLVNEKEGYILPGSTRTFTANWLQGYPAARVASESSGKERVSLDWNFSRISDLRFGYYTAKLVAVYNDGQRDVPVVGEVGFWVIPWKLMLGGLIVVLLVGFGLWSVAGNVIHTSKRRGQRVRFHK